MWVTTTPNNFFVRENFFTSKDIPPGHRSASKEEAAFCNRLYKGASFFGASDRLKVGKRVINDPVIWQEFNESWKIKPKKGDKNVS